MQIIGLCLRQEYSQVAFMDSQREFTEINDVGIITDPLLEFVIEGNVQEMAGVLSSIDKKIKNKKLLITYPSSLGYINCFQETKVSKDELPETWPSLVHSHLPVEKKEEYYFDAPLIIPQEDGAWFTGICLHKKYVETMILASKKAGYQLIEGEPESVAVARLLGNRQEICYLVEVEAENTTITSFNSQKGMFSIPVPAMGWQGILENEVGLNKLKNEFQMADIITHKIFGLETQEVNNIRIYILSNKSKEIIQLIKEQNDRMCERIGILTFPEIIRTKIDTEVIQNYSGPVVLGLKQHFERMNLDNEMDTRRKRLSGFTIGRGAVNRKMGLGIPFINRNIDLFALWNRH